MASDNNSAKIRWHMNRETRYPFSERSPDPEWFEPIGFPPPWPDRPWIYGVVVVSANGVLAWRRARPDDDPVLAVLGDATRPERIADGWHLRHLRCFGGVGLGAPTLRALLAPELVDEVFVTVTDRIIDGTAHEGVVKIFDFEAEGADLIAEGKISPPSGWTFRRWRFNGR